MEQTTKSPLFTTGIKLGSNLIILLNPLEEERLNDLYYLCYQQMDLLGSSNKHKKEGKKIRDLNQEIQFNVFYDKLVDQYLEEIRNILFDTAKTQVKLNQSVLWSKILNYIITKMYYSGRPWRPIIAIMSDPKYKSHDFQDIFQQIVERPIGNDGSTCHKNFRDVNQAGLALFLIRYNRHLNHPINYIYDNNKAFFLACQQGNLFLVKFLYQLGGVKLNISSQGSPLQVAKQNGHQEILDWVKDLKLESNFIDNSR